MSAANFAQANFVESTFSDKAGGLGLPQRRLGMGPERDLPYNAIGAFFYAVLVVSGEAGGVGYAARHQR